MAVGGDDIDVALVLAMDCSGSISNEHTTLQLLGYARAITSPAVLSLLRMGRHKCIGVTFLQWGGSDRQEQVVPWTRIDGAGAANRFALAVLNAPGIQPDYTSISGAIDRARGLIQECPFHARRAIIDVSGDGANNDGRPVTAARDDAVAAGITINGLPIMAQEPGIAEYYRRNVIGGVAAFVEVAQDMENFPHAIARKLSIEIT